MKKLGILFLCISVCFSCQEDVTLLEGDYIYYDGAAILQTKTEIYGVFITNKLKALNRQVEALKKTKTDMVTVKIKGEISHKKDDNIFWKNKVKIIEILSVVPIKKANENLIKLDH